jgi:hypothetical protein
MLHAYLPLPLLAADVGCCATLGLDLQRCRGHLFAAQVNQALDRFVRPASYRGPRRITGQRYCYNLCESRVGSATLIAAARGYAFSCRTERSLSGRRGTPCLPRQPDECRPRRRRVWGTKAKPLASPKAGGFAVCASAFCAGRHCAPPNSIGQRSFRRWLLVVAECPLLAQYGHCRRAE